MAVLGKSIYITLGGTKIAATKSCRLSTESESIEIASSSSGAWRAFIAGRKSWSMSCSWLVMSTSAMKAKALQVGTIVSLTFTDGTAEGTLSGQAICKKADVDANTGTLANGSFQFQGTGALV